MATERPRFRDHLDSSLLPEVITNFPGDYVTWFEEELHGVKRLGHGNHLPIKPGFTESDLEHSCEMLDILAEFKAEFVYIPREINFREVSYMIVMHDAGEIIVGDGPPFGKDRESSNWQKRKRIEPKAALRNIINKIPDPKVRDEMSSLYHRFARQDPNDKEALLTRLLDKAQGTTRTGPSYAFDYQSLGWQEPTYELRDHIQSSTSIFVDAVLNLQRTLSKGASMELTRFAQRELDGFRPIGFSEMADAAQSFLLPTT